MFFKQNGKKIINRVFWHHKSSEQYFQVIINKPSVGCIILYIHGQTERDGTFF